MVSFLISVAALILGFILYGRFVESIFKPDNRLAPAVELNDGMDYIPMPAWKVYMIQLLNIAGTGPIFGAIMGAKFGPASYLWIVFGCIFAGAVHDYLAGMMSMRGKGTSLPNIIGHSLGTGAKKVALFFTLILLLMTGAVFVYSPAVILGGLTGGTTRAAMIWVAIVLAYYIIATLLPIDKIIGKIYPVFALALIFMAVSLGICLVLKWPSIPEIWNGLGNLGAERGLSGLADQPILPCLFITIACGAISGFHATQSPMMARCMKHEKLGRPIFYGAMITEGLIALIWAAVSSYFFFDGGAAQVGSDLTASAPQVVTSVAKSWLGGIGGVLAILGVVAAPITTGDTALRSARLMVADALKFPQKRLSSRLLVSVPIFVITGLVLWFNIADENGFNTVWRYFGWANQSLACFTLWAITVWLSRRRSHPAYLVTLIPACFMTAISLTYISTAKIGFNMPFAWAPYIALSVFAISAILFFHWLHSNKPLSENNKE